MIRVREKKKETIISQIHLKRNEAMYNYEKKNLKKNIWFYALQRVNFQLKVIKLLENQSIFFSINFQIFFDRNEMSKKKYFHT